MTMRPLKAMMRKRMTRGRRITTIRTAAMENGGGEGGSTTPGNNGNESGSDVKGNGKTLLTAGPDGNEDRTPNNSANDVGGSGSAKSSKRRGVPESTLHDSRWEDACNGMSMFLLERCRRK